MAEAPDGAAAGEDSGSQFELTLDDQGGLAAVQEEAEVEGEDKDIFQETDFDVPALDEESASEAVALTDMETEEEESSEFDLDLDESGGIAEEDQDQPVVSLDEEEDADAAAETVARPIPRRRRGTATVEEEEGLDVSLDEDEAGEVAVDEEEVPEEEPAAPAAVAAPPRPAEWGVLPALFLLPTVIVLFLVGLMSFELIQGLVGYHKHARVSSLIVGSAARSFGILEDKDMPKD